MIVGHLSKVAILVIKWYSAWHRRVRHAQKAEGKETPGRFLARKRKRDLLGPLCGRGR
jgi:hypothetical protein